MALRSAALNILDEQVTIPPSSSIMVSFGADAAGDVEGVVEGNAQLLLDRSVYVARGIAHLIRGRTDVLVANFTTEFKHLNKGTTVATLDYIAEASKVRPLSDVSTSLPQAEAVGLTFDINPELAEK